MRRQKAEGRRQKVLERPLFIPLKREFFEAFERGDKSEEYRPYGPRWNEETCRIGRKAVISLGYGKQQRMQGTVVSFRKDAAMTRTEDWRKCYPDKNFEFAACIGIELVREQKGAA